MDTQDESTGLTQREPRGEQTLPYGTPVGRYVVHEALGRGGMGVVYEAEDLSLHRRVALKLLRQGADAGSARSAKLLEEAQKLAKLSHPNVVTVYTADTHREQVFIAMELLAGGTLTKWLQVQRTIAQTVKMFLAAGEGLAAAHEAGLVHRDFKPDNVLLDASGVPHVADFGLADAVQDGKAKGAFAGTQGFMSPEQKQGKAIDARSDQYSFCVALYWALYKEPPPEADPADGRKSSPRPQSTALLVRVPLWLRGIVKRGLEADPDKRFPSMRALLDALADDPVRKRRQRILTTVSGISVATVLALSIWLGTRESQDDRAKRLCSEHAISQAVALWSSERLAQSEGAFRRANASGVWTQVNEHLGDEVLSWMVASVKACALPQNDVGRGRFQACLEERRRTLDSMAQLFVSADEGVVKNAINTVMLEVQPATACERVVTQAKPPRAPTPADEQLRSALAEVRVRRAAAQYKTAIDQALTVRNRAEATDALELKAEAQLAVGELFADQLGDGAEEFLLDAKDTADALGNDELRARAWISLFGWAAERDKSELALFAEREGRAILDRLGQPPLLEADWYAARGRLRTMQGDAKGARESFAAARKLREEHLQPKDHPLVLRSRQAWAWSLEADQPERITELEAVLEARKKLFGERHAETMSTLSRLAWAHLEAGHCPVSLELFQQAMSAALDRVSEDPLHAGGAYVDLAGPYRCVGRLRQARDSAKEGLDLLRKGGASNDELQRVESLLRDLEDEILGRKRGPDGGTLGP